MEEAKYQIEDIHMSQEIQDEFTMWKNLGNRYVEQGLYELAQQAYANAQLLQPQSDVLMVNLGTLAIQQEDLSLAVEYFRKAVALNGANERAWLGLALVHRSFGDLELAWANLEKCLDISLDNMTALWLAVDWGHKDSRSNRVIQRLFDHIQRHPQDSPFRLVLARLLLESGRIFQARKEVKMAIEIWGECEGSRSLLKEIGEILKLQGQRP